MTCIAVSEGELNSFDFGHVTRTRSRYPNERRFTMRRIFFVLLIVLFGVWGWRPVNLAFCQRRRQENQKSRSIGLRSRLISRGLISLLAPHWLWGMSSMLTTRVAIEDQTRKFQILPPSLRPLQVNIYLSPLPRPTMLSTFPLKRSASIEWSMSLTRSRST